MPNILTNTRTNDAYKSFGIKKGCVAAFIHAHERFRVFLRRVSHFYLKVILFLVFWDTKHKVLGCRYRTYLYGLWVDHLTLITKPEHKALFLLTRIPDAIGIALQNLMFSFIVKCGPIFTK